MKMRLFTILVLFATLVSLALTLPLRAIAQGWQLPLVATYRPVGQPGAFVLDVVLSGDYAYVSVMNEHDWLTTLRVVDVANKLAPVEMGVYSYYNHISDLAVAGNYAFIVFGFQGWGSGMQIIDISNPLLPTRVGSFALSEDLSTVAIEYPYAYIGSSNSLRIVNVADPTNPVLVKNYPTAYPVQSIAKVGSYAYVAAGASGGLHVINVADPSNPTESGFCSTPAGAFGIAMAGSYAYLTSQQKGLRVIDVSDPTAPFEVGHYDTSWATDIQISGSRAFLIDYYAGLRVLDVADPANPTQVAYYSPFA